MKFAIRFSFILAAFIAVAGTVYAIVADEKLGTVLFLVLVAACLYLGFSLRHADRRARGDLDAETAEELGAEAPEEVEHTIWPFVLSIGALLLVIGAVGIHWVLVLSVIVFAIAGRGWFMDIQHQRVHAAAGGEHPSGDHPA